MSKILSNKLFARIVLAAALALCALVYYLKSPDVRAWVDAKAPAVKQWIGPLVGKWDERFSSAAAAVPVIETPINPVVAVAAATPKTEVVPAPSAIPIPASVEATPAPRSEDVDLALLSHSPAEWPKMVMLKQVVEFPAVLDGKVIGSLKAPAGAQARLVMIRGKQAGLEYQGGGAMVDISETDLIEEVLAARKRNGVNSAPVSPATTPVAVSTPAASPVPATSPVANAPSPSPVVPVVAPEPPASTLKLATSAEVQSALERAGENRPELEKAITESRATAAKEMDLLISRASQYDLVNLTAEHLADNVSTALKTKQEMEWGRSIPEEMWLEYVLPYRVADEDLDDWRPEFYRTLSPLLKDCHDTKTAARLIHQWLYKGGAGGTGRIDFKVSENRDQTPRQMLNQSKLGRCFEMNLLLVALLRSAGIPARHAGVAYWTNLEMYHYWVEYWDTGSRKWLALEPNANPDALMEKLNSFAVVYAFPGYHAEPDPVAREQWEAMTNVTSTYAKTGTLDATCPAAARAPGTDVTFSVYVWNSAAWRLVAAAQGNKGRATFELAANDKQYPYLVSASANGKIGWQLARVTAGKTEAVSLAAGAQQELVAEYKK